MNRNVFRTGRVLSFGLALVTLSGCGGRTLATDGMGDAYNPGSATPDGGAGGSGDPGSSDETNKPVAATDPNAPPQVSPGAGAAPNAGGGMVPAAAAGGAVAVVGGGMGAVAPDGSSVSTTIAKDGTSVSTSVAPDGTSTTTTVTPDGVVTVVDNTTGEVISQGSTGVASAGASSGGPIYVGPPPMIGKPGGFAGAPSSAGGGSEVPLVDCATVYDYEQSDWCETQLECGNGYQWTNCWNNGSTWDCDCSASYNYLSISVSGVSSGDACSFASDFCAGAPQAVDAPRECSFTNQSQGPDYCSMDRQCSVAYDTSTDGVDVSSREYESVWCQTYGTDTLCNCYSANTSLTITADATEAPAEKMCGEALDICSKGALELSGEISCSRSSQSAGSGWCNASLDCKQAAVANGRDLLISGYAGTNCTETSAGTWDCYCDGLGSSVNYTITGDDDWDTCSAAAQQCSDLVTGAGRTLPIK